MPASFVRRLVEAVVDRAVGDLRQRISRISITVDRLEAEINDRYNRVRR